MGIANLAKKYRLELGDCLLSDVERQNAMTLIPDTSVFQKSLAALPLATYQPGETPLTAGSKTGLLLILKKRGCCNRQGWH
jgi:hypothetical protein